MEGQAIFVFRLIHPLLTATQSWLGNLFYFIPFWQIKYARIWWQHQMKVKDYLVLLPDPYLGRLHPSPSCSGLRTMPLDGLALSQCAASHKLMGL